MIDPRPKLCPAPAGEGLGRLRRTDPRGKGRKGIAQVVRYGRGSQHLTDTERGVGVERTSRGGSEGSEACAWWLDVLMSWHEGAFSQRANCTEYGRTR